MDRLPATLSVEALALSPAETRAYPRWYTDLLLRKRGESIAVGDTMAFIGNFGVSEADKRRIMAFFGDHLVTVEPAQFYCCLRLTGHLKQGRSLRRELAFVSAPVPKPRSILSKRIKQQTPEQEETELDSANPFRKASPAVAGSQSKPNDMDTFMSLMTGRRSAPAKTASGRVKKRVSFDSRPPQVAEAAQRSMHELMRQNGHFAIPEQPEYDPIPIPAPNQYGPPQVEEEDVEIANNQFARVNIDSVLVHGQSSLPTPAPPPPPRRLTPNMTGPTQMVQLGVLDANAGLSSVGEQFRGSPLQGSSQPLSQQGPPIPPLPPQHTPSPLHQHTPSPLHQSIGAQSSGSQFQGQSQFPQFQSQPQSQQQSQPQPQSQYLQPQPQSQASSQPQFQSQFPGSQFPSSQYQTHSPLPETFPQFQPQPQQTQSTGLSDFASQFRQSPQPGLQPNQQANSGQYNEGLSPMPTGMQFLNSVSRSQYSRPAPPPRTDSTGPSEYAIPPPPPFQRRPSNAYDTDSMRNQINQIW